jgi:hypothetical protein
LDINNEWISSIFNCSAAVAHLDFFNNPLASLRAMYGIYTMNWRCTLEHYIEYISKEVNAEIRKFANRMEQEMEEALKKSKCY